MAAAARIATLRDVAAAAGVSAATVSRYLNASLVLPPVTAARIKHAIGALDYRPNPHARRLSLGRADAIGLVLPDIGNPFFAQLAAAVEAAADAAGLELMLAATLNRPERERAYSQRMRRNHVDGLIFVTNHGDTGAGPHDQCHARCGAGGRGRARRLRPQGVLRQRARRLPCRSAPAPDRSSRAGIHRRPVGRDERRGSGEGFRRAVRAAGPGARILAELSGPYSAAHGAAAASALLALTHRPTAIFAASDEIALGVLSVLKASGVQVPHEMSIIGFDDVGPLDLFDPPLTAIRQPVAEMGRQAVRLIGGAASMPPMLRLPVDDIRPAPLGGAATVPFESRNQGENKMIAITRRTTLGALGSAALALPALRAAAAPPTFALVTINQQALFFNQMNDGANAAAKQAGAKLVIFNANNDPAAQNNAIDDYIQQKVQGIIVDAINVNGIMPAVKAAAAAGIPVIAVDAILPAGPQKSQVGVDNMEGGARVAQFLAGYVKEHMNGKATRHRGRAELVHPEPAAEGLSGALKADPGIKLVQVVDGQQHPGQRDVGIGDVADRQPHAEHDLRHRRAGADRRLGGGGQPGPGEQRQGGGLGPLGVAIRAIDKGYLLAVVQQDPTLMGGAAVDALAKLAKAAAYRR